MKLLIGLARAVDQTQDATPPPATRETEAIRVASLTTRQRQVLDLVLAGYPSKNIAADLGISQRTVHNHRAAIGRTTSQWNRCLARFRVSEPANSVREYE